MGPTPEIDILADRLYIKLSDRLHALKNEIGHSLKETADRFTSEGLSENAWMNIFRALIGIGLIIGWMHIGA